MASETAARGPVWTLTSEDLNVNLIVLPAGSEIPVHVNSEVDVFVVGVSGAGHVTIDGEAQTIGAGDALLLPKGSSRSMVAANDGLAYLTCHRRRDGLWPRV
jgi:quercetin dioxygenase-like cupin family protein